MAGDRHSFSKRKRELERQRKKKEKAERRRQRKTDRDGGDGSDDAVDPDIAHIVPGPQAQPWMEALPPRGDAVALLAEDEDDDNDDDDKADATGNAGDSSRVTD